MYVQNVVGTQRKSVEALRSTVNRTIESARESVTTYEYHHFFSETDPARITGRTGNTQGARIVSIQAMKDAKISEFMG